MFVFIFLGYSLLVIYEFVPLYKQNLWRDFWVNAVLGMCSFVCALCFTIGVNVPSPAGPIKEFIESMFGKWV
ncbi:MAG: hypothetical protein K6T88_07395 [Bacillus sp. (in: Bacteria)]|jgi:hypothetical protein|nr:hypothetical protein [Bacillus sp. (in: firmicutes)]